MTPYQKVLSLIVASAVKWKQLPETVIDASNVEALYQALVEKDLHWDNKNEVRGGQVETGLPCGYSRHYESKAVAAKAPDGSWVGWTYWYGGDKYGEPEAMDWMEDAYDLDCKEEEKTVVVKTFTKKEAA